MGRKNHRMLLVSGRMKRWKFWQFCAVFWI